MTFDRMIAITTLVVKLIILVYIIWKTISIDAEIEQMKQADCLRWRNELSRQVGGDPNRWISLYCP